MSSSELGSVRTPGSPTPSNCPSEPDSVDATCTFTSAKERMRDAAHFVLEAKHVHKVVQSSLNGVMCDFTAAMLESTVHCLETGIMAALGNEDAILKTQVSEIS